MVDHTPFIIEPTKAGTFILKRGRWIAGQGRSEARIGDNIRWTRIGMYATLTECVEATKTGDNR